MQTVVRMERLSGRACCVRNKQPAAPQVFSSPATPSAGDEYTL